jgi:hypothetical protein
MTPKEKAEILRSKMFFSRSSIESASIAVDEIIDLVKHIDVDSEDYWNEVKQEIEKL